MKKFGPITISMKLEMQEITSISIALQNYMERCQDKKIDEPSNAHWEHTEEVLSSVIKKFDTAFDESPEVMAEKDMNETVPQKPGELSDRSLLEDFVLAMEDDNSSFSLRNLFLKVKDHLKA